MKYSEALKLAETQIEWACTHGYDFETIAANLLAHLDMAGILKELEEDQPLVAQDAVVMEEE